MEEKVIVAIELGSSKISGVAGQIMSDRSMKVLAYASVPSSSFIRHGAVYNLNNTANAIAVVVERLNSILSAKIDKVYVGYNSKGLKSVISKVEHKFDQETVVTQEVIDDMYQQCNEIVYEGYVNLFQKSQEYVVDNKRSTETDPIGVACRLLGGSYLNIMLKKQVADFIAQCFLMAQVEIVDGYVAPMAQADVVLTDDDRQQGCALVDYGADTVTVSVYKNGLLRYLRVIPLGSALITRDLAAVLQIEPAQAEKLKCTYGLCNLIGSQAQDEAIMVNDRSVPLKEIGEIIEARNEEIIRNVCAQINASGYADVLYAGIILTGGGSQLRELDQVFTKLMPSMRKPRVVTEPVCGVTWIEPSWKRGDGSQLSLLSVLARGDESCCTLPKMDDIDNISAENQDKVVQTDLFTASGESAQAERDRKEKEEREKAAARREEEAAHAKETQADKDTEKKKSMFRRLYENFIEVSETFFEDKEDKERKAETEKKETEKKETTNPEKPI